MLLIPVFHRVGRGKWATELTQLKNTLTHLKRFPQVLPGEKLQRGCNICLTFDDATCDFYHFVYPLLKELNLRALLAVPTAYILENNTTPWDKRLNFQDPFTSKNHFCTWEELREMQQSGHVQLASHAHTHPDLTKCTLDEIEEELTQSAKILKNPTTLIYPFGKMNTTVQRLAKKHYSYCMRIGNARNFTWNSLLYRIPMDGGGRLCPNLQQTLNYLSNRLRLR